MPTIDMDDHITDPGHFHTEKTAFRIFAERLKDMVSDQGWEVTVEMDENEIDPMERGWEY